MLCPNCHAYVAPEDAVCPICGTSMLPAEGPEVGIQAFRQGRKQTPPPAPAPADLSASRPGRTAAVSAARRRPVGSAPAAAETEAPRQPEAIHDSRIGDSGAIYSETEEAGYERYRSRAEGRNTPNLFPDQLQDRAYQPEKRWRPGKKKKTGSKIRTYEVHPHMVNWAHVAIAAVLLLIMSASGFLIWLTRSTAGQRMKARWGLSTSVVAMWEVGEEYLDSGAIPDAIALFEAAREMDGEEVDVDNLLLLGSAYEADGQVARAEELYRDLYENVVPTRSEPYANVIRIMLAQGRGQEAADLMLLAYEKTGRAAFANQRTELIPKVPVVNQSPGYYDREISLTLLSPEGYDVYFVRNDVDPLPEKGELYKRPILLQEGTHTIRALVMHGQLKSDEIRGVYQIVMPSPRMPAANLAPGEYKSRRTVKLRVNKENEHDKDITIYYTVDGSIPDADSPVWTGEAIQLPTGRSVWLKAMAVNGFGRPSPVLEMEYKISVPPYPLEAFSTEDKIEGMNLYYTKKKDFTDRYGPGEREESAPVEGFTQDGTKVYYSWGSATFAFKSNTENVLCDLDFSSTVFNGPRNTGYGQTESQITGAFRDLGQVTSPSGNRGLYYISGKGRGRITKNEDGTKEIRYTCNTADSFYWILTYHLNQSGVCDNIRWTFAKYL